ncbi:MAG: TonB family protein [Myxococcota bacterium]
MFDRGLATSSVRTRIPLRATTLALALSFASPILAQQAAVSPPTVIERTAPAWPEEPGPRDVPVAVEVTVGTDGTPSDVRVLEPGLDPELASAAVAAVESWRFSPARRGDVAVAARIRVELRFVGVPPIEPATVDVTPDAAPPEPSPDRPIDVRVRGKRRGVPPPTDSASDFQIDPGQLRDVPRRNAEQMLTLAPGFFLSNHGGEGHPSSVFLRGFDAGEGQDIRFEVDGVLINESSNAHGHGYADTNFVIPELIRTLRVLEGPFDPRQGDFAVAGSANYNLGLEDRGVIVQGAYGSFNRRRLLALWGPGGTTERTFAGFDVQSGDGFGPNRAFSSTRAMAQYEWVASEDLRVLLGAQAYAAEFDGAGVIREDDFEARRIERCEDDFDGQFFCLYDPNQGGQTLRTSTNLRLEYDRTTYRLEQQIYGVFRRNRLRENFTGFITDVAAEDEQRGDGLAQATEAFDFGARGRYERRIDWLDHRQLIELGYEVRHNEGTASQRRLRRSGREPYATDFNNGLSITNIGGFAAGTFRPLSWLTVRGGLRIDGFAFSVEDRNRPEVDDRGEREPVQTTESFGSAILPRASVQVRPLPETVRGLSIIASYGQGSRSSDAAALSDGEFAPFARVTAFDIGAAYIAGPPDETQLDSRLIGYLTKVDRDLVFDPNAGRNLLIGNSNRFGALASSRLRTTQGIDLQASVTYAEAFIPDDEAGFFDLTSGVRLPFIPQWVARIDSSVNRSFSIRGIRFSYELASGLSYVAPIPLPLGQLGEDVYMLDAAARLRWRFIEAGIEGTNLFDRRNRAAQFNYASNFVDSTAPVSQLAARHFAAGAPLQVLGTLTLYFETPLEDEEQTNANQDNAS